MVKNLNIKKETELKQFQVVNDKLWRFEKYKMDESPDFLAYEKEKVVGIEITQVIRKDYGQIIAANYKLEDELASIISNQLNESALQLSLHGMIDFKKDLLLSGNQKNHLCNRITSTIIAHSKNLLKESWSANHFIDKLLPDEVNWISYDCYPFLDESTFYATRGKTLEYLEKEDILDAIHKKESKLQNYLQKCDEVYLLLVEGLLPASWIGELREPLTEVDTLFTQVILLHYRSSKVIPIKK